MTILTEERRMRSFRNPQGTKPEYVSRSLNVCKVCFILGTKHCSNECVACEENVKLIRTISQYTGIASYRKRILTAVRGLCLSPHKSRALHYYTYIHRGSTVITFAFFAGGSDGPSMSADRNT